MRKTKTLFEIQKNERLYQFFCDPEASLGEAFDVLCEIQHQISSIMKEYSESLIKKNPEEKVDDDQQAEC